MSGRMGWPAALDILPRDYIGEIFTPPRCRLNKAQEEMRRKFDAKVTSLLDRKLATPQTVEEQQPAEEKPPVRKFPHVWKEGFPGEIGWYICSSPRAVAQQTGTSDGNWIRHFNGHRWSLAVSVKQDERTRPLEKYINRYAVAKVIVWSRKATAEEIAGE